MSLAIETFLMWSTVMIYAVSFILFAVGVVFTKPRLVDAGLLVAAVGIVAQAVAFGVRWVRVGHAPFLGFYEVVSAYAFATVVMLVLVAWRVPRLKAIGVVLMPLALLALGASMLADKSDEIAGGTLASWWLTVHVLFAKLSYSSFALSFALALVYLVRAAGSGGRLRPMLDRLPSQSAVDDLAFRTAGIGLVFLSVMIAAGAIWANEAWGRYWGWDPIETWSLVTWFVYAIYLHLRLTLGWRERRSAWILVGALPVVIFSFVVVPIVYNSIHAAYIRG